MNSTVATPVHTPRAGYTGQVLTYWFAPQPPHALAVFRILFGLYLLWYWVHRVGYVELLLSQNGMAFSYFGAPRALDAGLPGVLSAIFQPPSPAIAWAIYGLAVASGAAITLGVWTRLAVTAHLAVFAFSFLIQAYIVDTSYDRLILILLVLLAMSRSDAVFSLTAWKRARRGKPAVDRIEYWPVRLITAQIAIMYLGSGVLKIMAPAWDQGEILQYTFLGNWGREFAMPVVGRIHSGIWDLAALLTIIGEVYMPILLYHRKLQKVAFVLGTLFHLVIGAFLNIWPFMFMPLTYVLFVDPDRFSKWCQQKLAGGVFILRSSIPKDR